MARPRRWVNRLGGLAISEERRLAGQMAGALYLVGAVTALALLLLPAAEPRHWQVVVGCSAFGFVWGTICLRVIRWETAPSLVSHLSSSMGFPLTIMAAAATGGAESPARFYGLFILVYAAYFYAPREAIPYVVGVIAMHALPLFYDDSIGASGAVAEFVVMAPTYAVLGGRRSREGLGLVLLDLDNFKDVNTHFGHQGGDRVIAAAAQGLLAAARETDVVARLGGDEFAVVATDVDEVTVRELAERLIAAVRDAFGELNMRGLKVTASAGYAVTPGDATTVEGLIGVADGAMRTAKLVGKDCAAAPLRIAA